MSFLNAEWRKLAIANYAVDPALLAPYVPYGTQLDYWQNTCYVSLVGFMFKNTKLLGWKIPFHVNFEEANLRFYVKREVDGQWRRGVVFVKEIVPKPALSIVANTCYGEHYETLPMAHQWRKGVEGLSVTYQWKKNKQWQMLSLIAEMQPVEIGPGTEAEFITEHYWGYAKVNSRKTYEYEVTHPRWEQYIVRSHDVSVDFARVYGQAFAHLGQSSPRSVMLAEGSPITVEGKRTIR